MRLVKKFNSKTEKSIEQLNELLEVRSTQIIEEYKSRFTGRIKPSEMDDRNFSHSFINDPLKIEINSEIVRIMSLSIPVYSVSYGEECE